MHNISTFMPIQNGNKPLIPCTRSQRSCLFRPATNHQYRAQHLNVHAYSERQRTTNTVHNISTFMPIQNGNKPPIPCTRSQRSCLFRPATNHQYRAQHLNVHAYSDRQQSTNTVHNISTFMPIQTGNKPPILCTTSQRSCLFRMATNHQYHAQHLNVHAYSDRQQTTNTVHNISTFMAIQTGNKPPILCTTSQHSCLFRTATNHQYHAQHLNVHAYSEQQRTTNTVHNISTFMPIQNGNKPPIPCTTSQHSCLFRTATNHQYHAQHLNVHAYSDRQQTTNTVHNISTFMPIQNGNEPPILCTTSRRSCLFRMATNHQYCTQHLDVHAYSERQRTTNTVHNISTFMPIQNGNEPPIPCTTSQRSCLFRPATNHQYCAQHLDVHAYSDRQQTTNTVHNISTFMAIQNGNEPPILCTTSQRSCLFRTATNHQYCAQHLDVHAYSDRQQTTNTVHISTFMPIQNGNKPPILCTTSQRSCLFRMATTTNTMHNISMFMPIQTGNKPPILCTTSQRSWLFRTATNHQYCAQHLNVHAYSDRQQSTNTVHNISMFMPIQNGNKPPILCTTFQRSCLFRTATNHQYHAQHLNVHAYSDRQQTTNTVHNISTFMAIQNGNKPPIPCTTSQRSCLFRTATNHQYHAQHLNVHAYSDRQQTTNTVHNISTFMPIQTGTNHQYCEQHLNVHAYSDRQETTNTVHNVSTFMPIQTGNKPPILCTTSQRSCLFRMTTNCQYCGQHLNVHAYSEWQETTNTVHNISTFMPIQNGNEPPIPCTTSQRSCLFRTTTNRQDRAQRLNISAYLERQRNVNAVHNVSTFLPI